MEQFIVNTPEGTRDRLFSECRDRRAVQSKITGLFKRRGYSEVITPEVEYYDLFVRSGDPLPQESMLKIIDRSGKILVCRPDCTTPIARIAATRLKGFVFPQRLYYNQTIFRSDEEHIGTDSEIAQCGIELIGAAGLRGDIECIAMAVDALSACGTDNFHIELGHAGFFPALINALDCGDEAAEKMRLCIEKKNFAALGDILRPYAGNSAALALERLPFLFGDVSILDEAEALVRGSGSEEALIYLREIYGELSSAGRGGNIRFDLGLVNRLDYYTGVVFRGYAEGAGNTVLVGGRYDNLVGMFGTPLPSTGFAVYLDSLVACLPKTIAPRMDTVIHYEKGMLNAALSALDAAANGTAEISPYETPDESLWFAKSRNAAKLLIIDSNGVNEVSL